MFRFVGLRARLPIYISKKDIPGIPLSARSARRRAHGVHITGTRISPVPGDLVSYSSPQEH
eukprot:13490893-Heterocapsa_arctica.AAC.1